MGQEDIKVTVVIAGRPYPLKIKSSEERIIRKAAKAINDKVNEFQRIYTNKDKQDLLSIALLTFAVENQRLRERLAEDQPVPSTLSDQISAIEQILDDLLR